MRGCQCYYSAKGKNRWEQNPNTACWAGIQYYNNSVVLRIERWKDKSTEKYAKLLTSIINQITPCKIYRGFIYYTLIGNGTPVWSAKHYYDRNLILLNFIRYLWHNYGDSVVFFKALEESKEKDPFKRLSEANLKNSIFYGQDENRYFYFTPGHSNIDTRQKSLISLETFLNYTGNCTGFFNQ